MTIKLQENTFVLVRNDSTGELMIVEGKTTPEYTLQEGFSIVPPYKSGNAPL